MRYAVRLALAFVAHAATAQRPYDLPIRHAPVRTIAEFPGVQIGAVMPSANPNRLYYNVGDKLYVFDVNTKKSALVAEGEIWNLDISPTNDRLVFARDMEDGKVSNVWTMPLDPKTGLATAPARRLALTPGDQPRVSPDGKWVAFAAYDSSDWSATQHLAIIGADGGAERVVARLTGGIWRIQWTPDGRTIYFVAGRRRGDRGGEGSCSACRPPVVRSTRCSEIAAGPSPASLRTDVSSRCIEDGSVSNYVITDARGVPVSRFSVRRTWRCGLGMGPRLERRALTRRQRHVCQEGGAARRYRQWRVSRNRAGGVPAGSAILVSGWKVDRDVRDVAW